MPNKIRERYGGQLPEEMLQKLEASADRRDAFIRLAGLLENDFQAVRADLDANRTDQLQRRTLIRTLFAEIEGAVFVFKQLALESHRLGVVQFSPSEYALLTEESYDLKDNGEPHIGVKFLRLQANLRFTFSVYARVVAHQELSIDTKGVDWKNFGKAIEIRNRITHPKSLLEIEISDADLDCILKAHDWFKALARKLTLDAVMAKLFSPPGG